MVQVEEVKGYNKDQVALGGWSGANSASSHALLTDYHEIFSLEPGELG